MCWFCGEYLIPRIGITLIGIFTIILCFLACFPVTIQDYCKRIRGCVNSCFYKKATIVSVHEQVPVVKKGDTIYYDALTGHDIAYGDTMYKVIRARDIVLVE